MEEEPLEDDFKDVPEYADITEIITTLGNADSVQQDSQVEDNKLYFPENNLECSVCKEKFNNDVHLKIHGMLHQEEPYCFICKKNLHIDFKGHVLIQHFNQCSLCFKAFFTKRSLDRHMELHSENMSYLKCLQCTEQFKQQVHLKKHTLFVHHGIKKYQCKHCSQVFTYSKECKKHMRICKKATEKHKPTTLECSICSELLNSGAEKRLHEDAHIDCRECKPCKKPYPDRWKLKVHLMKVHFNTEKCPHCPKLCHKTFLPDHIAKLHEPKRCKICNAVFYKNVSLAKHLDAMHTSKLKCNICAKLVLPKTLEKHRQLHQDDKLQKCTICNQNVINMDVHRTKIHKNTEFIFCSDCPKKFKNINDRLKHKRRAHSDLKNCPQCCKRFEVSKFRKHFNEKHPNCIYNCRRCSKSFLSLPTLALHEKIHVKYNGKIHISCSKCGRNFRFEKNYKKHTCFQVSNTQKISVNMVTGTEEHIGENVNQNDKKDVAKFDEKTVSEHFIKKEEDVYLEDCGIKDSSFTHYEINNCKSVSVWIKTED